VATPAYAYDTAEGRRSRMASIGADLVTSRSDRNGDVVMQQVRYRRYAGVYEQASFLWIYLCLAGGGRLVRMSGAQSLDGLLLPGRVGIGAPRDGGEGLWQDMELLALGISEGRLRRLVSELPEGRIDVQAAASRFHDDGLLPLTLQAIWESSERHGLSTAFFDHALAVVVHRLGDGAVRPRGDRVRKLGRRQADAVIGFIEANLGEDLSVAGLASLTGLSAFHFSRCFQATTGLAPYAFITRARLTRAAELLSRTDVRIGDIAAHVGYGNTSQFSAAFRRWKGVTPLTFRHLNRMPRG
jgi:AraC family transcriptional regulator